MAGEAKRELSVKGRRKRTLLVKKDVKEGDQGGGDEGMKQQKKQ